MSRIFCQRVRCSSSIAAIRPISHSWTSSPGMPGWSTSHDERELWELVAFVRHLPQLTAEEKQALKAAAAAARR